MLISYIRRISENEETHTIETDTWLRVQYDRLRKSRWCNSYDRNPADTECSRPLRLLQKLLLRNFRVEVGLGCRNCLQFPIVTLDSAIVYPGQGIENDKTGKKKGETYDVNQNVQRAFPSLDKFSGIMFLPFLFIFFAEIALECLLTPGAIYWICNWSKCADRFVFSWVAEKLYCFVSGLKILHSRVRKGETVCIKQWIIRQAKRTRVRAPWPPILCPVILTRLASI